MIKLGKRIGIYLASVSFVVASGCATERTVVSVPDTASPTEETRKFETEISMSRSNQIDVLSPKNFQESESSLESAKENLKHSDHPEYTLKHVAEGRAYLERANDIARKAELKMPGVVNARERAIKAGAQDMFRDNFRAADNRLRKLTQDIEGNYMTLIEQNRGKMQAEYLDLELRAIRQTYVGPIWDVITLAEKEGAKTYAPRTLTNAENEVNEVETQIKVDRDNRTKITQMADTALKTANFLLKITRESKMTQKISPEETALRQEAEKQKSAEKDKALSQEQATSTSLATDLQNTEAEKARLEGEKQFDEKFAKAQAEFTNDEAEVYRQGNTLMIRLKGLSFPESKAKLTENKKALLAKVQKVIGEFGKSKVTVEGHTDSIGKMDLNERLSKERAEIVKDYLTANAPNAITEIKTIGQGYQKPIATNKTKAGRAQNRRVDIIIEPETTTQ